MPRTGGVYSPPAGTKGVPNTTIQSVPYNTFIDDLTADANAARPVTAGGTGATSASGARTALGVEIGTNVQAYDALLQAIAALTTSANQMVYLTATDAVATTPLTSYARSILDDADAPTARTTLGLGTAATQNTGTSGATVPLLNGANTFSTTQKVSASAATTPTHYLLLEPTDYGTGKPRLEVTKSNVANYWGVTVFDGTNNNGTINFNVQNLTHLGNTIWTAGNMGPGSGSNADLLDGQHGAYYADIPGRLGFTPVQQGGGAGQGTNKVYIGFGAGLALKAQVDVTDLGNIWTESLAGGAPSSGWVKLPNGLILQTGSSVVSTNGAADGSITFPTSFPAACNSVTAVIGDTSLSSTDLKVGAILSISGFNFRAPGAPSTSVRVNWIAWGY